MQPVSIHQIAVGPMANFSYIIEDTSTKIGAYVDPGWEAEKVIAYAKDKGIRLEKILITHSHFDHIQEAEKAYNILKIPVYVPKIELKSFQELNIPLKTLQPEDVVSVGTLKIRCLFTPGHTPGALCFMIDHHLITGDTLFVDGCGRIDLPGSNPHQMSESLKKLSALPEETIIYPGHDYGPTPTDTIGRQKKTNGYLMKGERLLQ